jgi:methylthioribose-1-phosphate isomerase
MLINGSPFTSLTYFPADNKCPEFIRIIDQRFLPFQLVFCDLFNLEDTISAIAEMKVRGAPLIGITAAFGLLFALKDSPEQETGMNTHLSKTLNRLLQVRPTAYNIEYCLDRMLQAKKEHEIIKGAPPSLIVLKNLFLTRALELLEEDKTVCRRIGESGVELLKKIAAQKGKVNILTHCNAGWLACIDYGTATSPIYLAHELGIELHVWVDETRPKNQGARLTVWELTQNGIANTLITDNAGGHLMQRGLVDIVIVGCDRVTRDGNAANKIGTYLKALAARDNNIPFYVALPSSTIDWKGEATPKAEDTHLNIPIENRASSEVSHVEGWYNNELIPVLITDKNVKVYNPGFDVTPAKYITALITERGICPASREGIIKLFPEFKAGI